VRLPGWLEVAAVVLLLLTFVLVLTRGDLGRWVP
jgi:hypothetical protein